MIFSVRLPLPPSLNAMYTTIKVKPSKTNPTGTRRVLSAEAKAWKRHASALIRTQLKKTPWDGGWPAYALSMDLWFETKHGLTASDCSNRVKLAEDTLSKLLGIDDSQIYDLHVRKLGVGMFGGFIDMEINPHALPNY